MKGNPETLERTETLERIEAFLSDIAESLAVMSGRKKPYEPTFLETFGFGDTDPQQQKGAGIDNGDPSN